MKRNPILTPGQVIRQYTGDESHPTINHAPAPARRRSEMGATEAL